MQDGKGVISAQVVQAFINVATRKFEVPFSVAVCRKYLDSVLAGLCRVNTTIDLCRAALQSGCDMLYSEDLHNSHQIMGLTIVNPFIET